MRHLATVHHATLALTGLTLMLAGCSPASTRPSSDAATPSAVATPSPSASDMPTPVESAAASTPSTAPADPVAACTGGAAAVAVYESGEDLRWERLPEDGAFAESIIDDVVAFSGDDAPGFVAIGSTRTDADPQAPWSPAAWTSPDGIHWIAASEPPSARRVLRVDHGYLAWDGAIVSGSADGDRWEELGPIAPDATTPRWLDIAGFERLGRCVLAAGYEELPDGEGDARLRTWLSPDGSTWTEVTPQLPDAWTGARIEGITPSRDGVVAWGTRHASDGYAGATLRSTDGRTWELGGQGLETEGYARDYMSDVALGPTGLVAVGGLLQGEAGSDPPAPAAWTSQDGLAWTRVPVEGDDEGGGFLSLTWDGSRFLATRRPGLEAEVWSSPDGTRWTKLSSAPDVAADGAEEGCTGSVLCPRSSVIGLAGGEAGVVAFGFRDVDGGNLGVLWAAPRSGP